MVNYMSKFYRLKKNGSLPLLASLNDDGILRIICNGQNDPWTVPDLVPWKDERSLITSVEFAENVNVPDLTNWFWGCENLIEIRNWPANVRKMQATCCDCYSLAKIPDAFPDTLTDLDECFIRCYELTSVPAIPAGVIYAADTFASCHKLAGHVTIQGRLTEYAFMFQDAGSNGKGIILDYSSALADAVDKIVATNNVGKVAKGEVIG